MSVVHRRQLGLLATVAIAAAVLDLAVLVFFQLARPDVDPLLRPTSEYALGAFGVLSPIAMIAVGLGALALAAALREARAGAILLAVYGIAKIVQAFFPINAPGTASTAGAVHDLLGNLAFFALPIAAALLARVLQERGWRFAMPAAMAVILATLLLPALGETLGAFGLLQRISLVVASLWMLGAGLALLRGRLSGGASRTALG
jgi:hypothetical protein